MYNPLLDCFILVAEHGTFTKAGEIMLISPTAVMKQINSLERHLGLKLFDRSNQGAVLTPEGKLVYDQAIKIKKYSKQVIDEIHRQLRDEAAVLRIGSSLLHPCEPFLNLWYRINAAFPRYSINLISFNDGYEDVLSDDTLIGERLDFIVGAEPAGLSEKLRFTPIGEYSLCVALPRTNPLAAKKKLTYEDLAGKTLMIPARGQNADIDRLRDELETEHEEIKIDDVDMLYSLEAFTRCRQVGNMTDKFLLALDCWRYVDPALILLPVDWDFTVASGLIYRSDPTDVVAKVLSEVEELLGPMEAPVVGAAAEALEAGAANPQAGAADGPSDSPAGSSEAGQTDDPAGGPQTGEND